MTLPPLDLHAHVAVSIPPHELTALRAVIFAATRTLDEAERALERFDEQTVWGVGCHPKLARAQRDFDSTRFAALVERTAFVSEIGLDGDSRVPMATQRETLDAVLSALTDVPRITSLHCYRATEEMLDALEAKPIQGAVLHWWLGDARQTARAADMGCFFSINAASVRRRATVAAIPPERILTETDHPFGDRRNGQAARPGAVADVERALVQHMGVGERAVRMSVWENFAALIKQSPCDRLLPRRVRLLLMAH